MKIGDSRQQWICVVASTGGGAWMNKPNTEEHDDGKVQQGNGDNCRTPRDQENSLLILLLRCPQNSSFQPITLSLPDLL